jgi:HAD superfamily hydrolase (TIGR01509 family)
VELLVQGNDEEGRNSGLHPGSALSFRRAPPHEHGAPAEVETPLVRSRGARADPGSLAEGGRVGLIRALVLDFDGLILDTETPLRLSWEEIYREAGLAVSPVEWAAFLGTAADPPAAYDLMERHLGRSVDREALRLRCLTRENELLAKEVPLPGVRDVLDEAGRMRLLLAVASSSERAWVEGHLARFALRDRFDAVVCAEDVDHTKPFPDLYVEALRRLGVAPVDAIAFEDSAHGVRAAKDAGLFCVAVPNRVTRHLEFPDADLIMASLDERPLGELIREVETRLSAGSS